jgi:hypothetical protein
VAIQASVDLIRPSIRFFVQPFRVKAVGPSRAIKRSSSVPLQIGFDTDSQNPMAVLMLHTGNLEQNAPRVDESVAESVEAALPQQYSLHRHRPLS